MAQFDKNQSVKDGRREPNHNKGKSMIEDREFARSYFTPERMHRDAVMAQFEEDHPGASSAQWKAHGALVAGVYAKLSKDQ